MLRTSHRANQVWYLLYLDLKSKKFSEKNKINYSIQMDYTFQRKNDDDYVNDDKDAEVDNNIANCNAAQAYQLSPQLFWGCKTAGSSGCHPSGSRRPCFLTFLSECDGSGRSRRTASTLT